MSRLFLGLPLALLAVGCVTMNPKAQYTRFGAADISGDRHVVEQYTQVRNDPPNTAANGVLVLIDTLPDGIEVNGGGIHVKDGYPYRVMGKFELEGQGGSPLWFADYKSPVIKGICWPQVPLTWLTLTAWIMVPTDYPCWGTPALDKEVWIDHAKVMANSAGGNFIIGSFLGADQDRALGFSGFIFQADPSLLDRDKLKTHPFQNPADPATPHSL